MHHPYERGASLDINRKETNRKRVAPVFLKESLKDGAARRASRRMPRRDLDPPPAPEDHDDASSRVAQERVGVSRPSAAFWVLSLLLAGAVLAALLALGAMDEGTWLPGEAAHADDPVFGLLYHLPTGLLRAAAAVAAAVAVLATAHAGRTLAHSDLAGLTAGALVALDPAFLVDGHLAVPTPFLLLAATGSLALALSRFEWMHWTIPAPMLFGALIDPWFLVWGVPLAALLLLRGHIYAAPKHLATAVLQAFVGPALVVLPVAATLGTAPDCTLRPGEALFLAILPDRGLGHVAVHNPALWIAGALTLAGLAVAGVAHLVTRFRIARLPGRLQLRLPGPLPPLFGRALWLLLFWVAAPDPLLWLPLFAFALALGARRLADDGLGFGFIVHAALLGFALVYLVRFWGLIVGADDGAAILAQALPWAETVACPAPEAAAGP